MGQDGDITSYKKISGYICIHTQANFAVDMLAGTYAHIGMSFHLLDIDFMSENMFWCSK